MNHALGNIGQTVSFHPSSEQGPSNQIDSLSELARDIRLGLVDTLVILGANPAYDAPADLDFAGVLRSNAIKLRIHLGLHDDETAQLCHWHIPEAHFLEAWSDLRTLRRDLTIQQPMIAPLYQGKSAHDVLAVFLGESNRTGLEILPRSLEETITPW